MSAGSCPSPHDAAASSATPTPYEQARAGARCEACRDGYHAHDEREVCARLVQFWTAPPTWTECPCAHTACYWCREPIFWNAIAGKWAHEASRLAPCQTRATPIPNGPSEQASS